MNLDQHSYLDIVLLGILPYIALTLLISISIFRYRNRRFSYTTLSSQFIESKVQFWGAVPWHYGIIIVLLGHFLGLVIPQLIALINQSPTRLLILESIGLALAFMSLFGIGILLIRRLTNGKLRSHTRVLDYIVISLLLIQVLLGILVALYYKYGSVWSGTVLSDYLWSIVTFQPNLNYVYELPIIIKLHIVNTYFILAIFPFTRLVHLFSIPIKYVSRPMQRVIWYRSKNT